jgi:hypothetical protein
MTALCGGGPSRPRANTPESIILSSAGACAALHRWGLDRLCEAVVAAVSGKQILASVLCSTDPPADPGLTAQDWIDLLNFTNSGESAIAGQRVAQWFLHNYWTDICECSAVATPPVTIVVPPQPTGTDPNLQRTVPAPCFVWSGTLALPASAGSGNLVDYTSLLFPQLTPTRTVTVPGNTPTVTAVPVPPGLKSITSTVTLDPADPTSSGAFVSVGYWDASGTSLRQDTIGQGSTHTPVNLTHFAAPAGAATWAIYTNQAASAGVQSDFSVQLAADCGGAGFTSDCCPPDPSVDLRFRQIIELITNLSSSGSSPPTSWRDSTRHDALSGSGRLVFTTGTVGVRVEITTLPPGIDQNPGNPVFYFDAGFITPIAIDVPLRGQRLVFNPQSFAMPQFADGISWTLPVGMVINLVELAPVP